MKKVMKPQICIPIVEKTEQEILATAKDYAGLTVDLVEWRIDFFEGIADYEKTVKTACRLKEILPQKLIVTWRTIAEGGEPVPEEISYEKMLTAMIEANACDYLDMEMERVCRIFEKAKKAGIQLIGSYHNFDLTPSEEEMLSRLKTMKELGFDIAKIAVMPKEPEDVTRLLSVTETMKEENPDYPLITMAMGEFGRVSRLYGFLYGSSVTFASAGKVSAPGQVDIDTVKKAVSIGDRGKRHIILTGFMGTGKSTVSKILQNLTGKEEIDTDYYIEQTEGRKIKDIFAKEGEEAFRQMETAMIDELEDMEEGIVSCGGGMVLRDINVKKLKQVGTIVLLTATPETILNRVKGSTGRPLLNGNMNVEFIGELMEKRRPYYEKAAELIIPTDEMTPEEAARQIFEHFI